MRVVTGAAAGGADDPTARRAETVYAQFESKAGILARVVGVAVAGDHDDAGLARRARRVRDRLCARAGGRGANRRDRPNCCASSTSAAPASSPWSTRLPAPTSRSPKSPERCTKAVAPIVLAAAAAFPPGQLRPGLDVEAVGDIFWTLAGPGVYTLLTGHLGRSPDDYEQWLQQRLVNLLLEDH